MLQIKVMCMAEGKKTIKRRCLRELFSNGAVVTGMTSVGNGEEKIPTVGRRAAKKDKYCG